MIFAARGVMVSLAFFAVLYTFSSLLLGLAWRGWHDVARAQSLSANTLFCLRVLPLALSTTITLFLTFPSFLLLESHSMDEDFGTFVLCSCSLLLLGAGLYRVFTAQTKTRRAVLEWLKEANDTERGQAAPTNPAPENRLPIILVGIRMPRVLVSETARAMLTEGELRVAVRHEMVHLRSRDNLKKAIFNFVTFPGMASLERAWQEAAELAADRGAVSNRNEALDLASALVKLSRGVAPPVTPAFATGLVGVAESIAMRVERLLEWTGDPDAAQCQRYVVLAFGVAVIFVLAANLGSALAMTHSLTELLVP